MKPCLVTNRPRESSLISGVRPREGSLEGEPRAALVGTSPHLLCPQPLGNVPRPGRRQHSTENTWKRPSQGRNSLLEEEEGKVCLSLCCLQEKSQAERETEPCLVTGRDGGRRARLQKPLHTKHDGPGPLKPVVVLAAL